MINLESKVIWNGEFVADDFTKQILKSLLEGAVLVEGRAVFNVPVDQGNLRGSITFVIDGSKNFQDAIPTGGTTTVSNTTRKDFGEFEDQYTLGGGRPIRAGNQEALIGTVVFYGPYVENGTRFMKAQAFLEPAFESSLQEVRRLFNRNLKGIKWVQ